GQLLHYHEHPTGLVGNVVIGQRQQRIRHYRVDRGLDLSERPIHATTLERRYDNFPVRRADMITRTDAQGGTVAALISTPVTLPADRIQWTRGNDTARLGA